MKTKRRKKKIDDMRTPGQRNEKVWLYFAYGSNLNKEQMKERCPDSLPMVKGVIYAGELIFKTYADVVKNKKKHVSVVGAIYEITKSDMKELDKYEGFPRLYKKVNTIVTTLDGSKQYKCFMYVMQPGVRDICLPSLNYFDTICQGYDDWKLNTYCLFNAWERTANKLNLIEEVIR